MQIVLSLHQFSILFKPFHDRRVGIFDEHAFPERELLSESTIIIYRTDHRNPGSLQYLVIFFSETRTCTDDTTIVFGANVVCAHSIACSILFQVSEEGKQRLIAQAGKLLTLVSLYDLVVRRIFVVVIESPLPKNIEDLIFHIFDLHIIDIRSECEGKVRREGPWCSGPCEKVGILFTVYLESDRDSWIDYILVPSKIDFE